MAFQLIDKLDVGRDNIRVALVIYGQSPNIQFNLNQYDNKRDIQTVIQGLNFPGDTDSNLGAALERVIENVLSPEEGGRQGVPQVLVIITAGYSTDDISNGQDMLRQAGVTIIGVSLDNSAYSLLQTVASDRSLVLASDVSTIASMSDQLLSYIKVASANFDVITTEFIEGMYFYKMVHKCFSILFK